MKTKRYAEIERLKAELDAFKALIEESRVKRLQAEQNLVKANTERLRMVDERDAERRALNEERSEHYCTQSALATVHNALSSRDLVSMYNAGYCVCQRTHDREKR